MEVFFIQRPFDNGTEDYIKKKDDHKKLRLPQKCRTQQNI